MDNNLQGESPSMLTPIFFKHFRIRLWFLPKECPMVTQTSVFQTRIPLSNVIYLLDIFFENVDVSESKFEQVVVELFNFVY